MVYGLCGVDIPCCLRDLNPVFAQVYEHATIWGDTAKTWEASWDRSLCGSVQCVEEHYVVRVTHIESGLQAFPDIVTAVGVVSVQFQLPRSGHYIVWVKAVNPIGESAWAKLEEGINTAVQYQPRGAWLYTQPAAPSF